MKSLTGMFAQLQLCHENLVKLAGHMVELSKTIPPQLCSPAELKFDKTHLTPAERKERAANLMLPRPYCHDLKEDLMGTKFFIIFVKYVIYDWG